MNVVPRSLESLATSGSAEFIAALADQSPTAVVVLDLHQNVRWATRTAGIWLGIEPDAMAGAPWSRVAPAWCGAVSAFQHAVAGGATWLPDTSLAGLDGNLRVCRARVSQFHEAGEFSGLLISIEPAAEAAGGTDLPWSLAVGLWDLDLETGTVSWHSDWCALHGLDLCDEPGGVLRWNANVHPDDRERLRCHHEPTAASLAECYRAEFRVRTTDGGWRWLHSRARVSRRATNGAPRALTGFCMDIDRMKAVEAELLQSRQITEITLEGARAGLWTWDDAAKQGRHSDFFYRLLGVTPAEGRADAHFWSHRSHPDDRTAMLEDSRRLIAGEIELLDREHRMQHSDGSWRRLLIRSRAVQRDAQGHARLIAGIVLDVTARHAAAEALRASEERFQLANRALPGSFYDIDLLTGQVRRFGTERLLGYAPEEFPGVAGWKTLVHPDDLADAQRALYPYRDLEGNQAFALYRARRRDGEYRHLEDHVAYSRDADGRPVRMVGFTIDVTERVRGQRAVERSEALLRAAAKLVSLFVFDTEIVDSIETRIAITNEEAFEGTFGCSFAEYQRRGGWAHFIEPADATASFDRRDRVFNGEATTGEVRIRNIRGEIRWLAIASQPIVDVSSGKVVRSLGAIHDITERKRREVALLESREMLTTVTESTPDWLHFFDRDLRCRFSNRGFRKLTPSECVGRSLLEFGLSPVDVSAALVRFRRILADGQPLDSELESCDAVRGRRWFHERLRAVRSGGRIVGVVSHATETTERRRRDERLRLQGQVFSVMREGIVLVDGAGTVRLTNPAAAALFGIAQSDMLGRPAQALLDLATLRQRIATGADSAPCESELKRFDGSRFTAAVMGMTVMVDGAEHWLAVLTDVTERKQLEREVIDVTAREQQRIGNDLHDGLGQDLTGIAMILRSVARELEQEGSPARGEIEDVIGLVNGAIDSARALARGLSPVNSGTGGLCGALQVLAERFSGRRGHEVHFLHPEPCDCEFDELSANHLYRIAQEAVTNAIRHGKAPHVSIDLQCNGRQFVLIVSDDGSGLPAKQASGGGMGLRTMRYRASLLQAELTLRNGPNGGVIVRCSGAIGTP